MSSSTTNLDLIQQSQAQKEVTANALFDAASPAMVLGRRASTTSGLTWGYYGGAYVNGSAINQLANGTVSLAASATNYVEFDPSSGTVSANTTGFTSGRTKMYTVVCGASTATSYTDVRVLGGGGSGGGGPAYLKEDTTSLATAPTVASGTKSWAIFSNAKINTGANQSVAWGDTRNDGPYSMSFHTTTSGSSYGIYGGAQYSFLWGNYSEISGAASHVFAFGQQISVSGSATNAVIMSGGGSQIQGGSGGVVFGGYSNILYTSASNSGIFGGNTNAVATSVQNAAILGGDNNNNSGFNSAIIGGKYNKTLDYYTYASGYYAIARRQSDRTIASGRFAYEGDAQRTENVLRVETSSTSATELFIDGGSVRFSCPNGYTMSFRGTVAAVENSSGDAAGWDIKGVIKNVSSTCSLVGTPSVVSTGADTGAAGWTFTVSADNTNKALKLEITAASGVKCVCHLVAVEILR